MGRFLIGLVCAAAGVGGCSSAPAHPPLICADGCTDAGTVTNQYPAPHPSMPQVENQGGPVLMAPVFIPITFDGDPLRADLETFVSTLGTTRYFTSSVTEYGGSAGKSGTPVHLSEAPPTAIDDPGVQAWLLGKLDGTHPEFGTPDANTVYVIFYLASTTVTFEGLVACETFGGYHSSVALPGGAGSASYAVLPRCTSLGRPQLQGLDATTGAGNHELVEATTDPLPLSKPAYLTVDGDHVAWPLALGGGEVGDLCAQDPNAFVQPPDYPYTLQRTWSNAQAAAGHDPCVPALVAEVYFNAAPVLDDTISFSLDGQSFTTKGVHIAIGQTKVIEVDLWSDGPMNEPWGVTATDLALMQGQTPQLGLALNAAGGLNGQKLQLTVTVAQADPTGVEGFVLTSTFGGSEHFYPGLIATP
jgi:hypothetical protein